MVFQKKNNKFVLFSYFLLLVLVYLFYQDYGVHIEEKFHRMNGLYWLNYIAQTFNFEKINLITEIKMKEVSDLTLSSVAYYDKYGTIFDVPLALVEIIFNIKKIENVYHLKHLLSFFIFLISSFFFYKILIKRFKNSLLCIIGTVLFITSPRIFGDSFLYKDVLFLSIFTITLYFFLETVENLKVRNLIYFSIFSAILFNLRVFGIFLPIVFFIILLIKYFYTKNIYKYFKFYFFYLLLFFILIVFFSPYLWTSPISNFIDIFTTLKETGIISIKILFNNNYISNRNVPATYLVTWMLISTPILIIVFFLAGYVFYTKRFLDRFLKIKEVCIYNDLWRSDNEQKDFIIFFLLNFYFFAFAVFDAPLHNGWRLCYFLNIFIIYFFIYQINNFFLFFRKKNLIRKFFFTVAMFSVLYNVNTLVKYHPYQSYYFNELISDKKKNEFAIDYHGLAAKDFFLKLIKLSETNGEKLINIGVASFTPIQRGLEGIDENLRKNLIIVGQEYELADYIFKNNISEVDHRLNKKYTVPENFDKIHELKINGLKMYEIYKNKNIK